jgi:hypothetical protein
MPGVGLRVMPQDAATSRDPATILPERGIPSRTPQSLPLRERVLLGQRIAIARAVGTPWSQIASAEQMRERTLRHFHRGWLDDLEREEEDGAVLLRAIRNVAAERSGRRATPATG